MEQKPGLLLADEKIKSIKAEWSGIDFDKYESTIIWPINGDVKVYFCWQSSNEKLVKNKSFDWNGVFSLRPIFDFNKLNSDSAVIETNFNEWVSNKKFDKLNEGIQIDKNGYLKEGLRQSLSIDKTEYREKAEGLIKQIEEWDNKMVSVLKPFYFETEQRAIKNDDKEALKDLEHDIKFLFQTVIRGHASIEILQNELTSIEYLKWAPEPLFESATNGVLHLHSKKDATIKQAEPYLKEWQKMQRAIDLDLKGEPLIPEKYLSIRNKNDSEEKLKKLDQRDNYHKHRKKQVVKKYKELREDNPELTDSKVRGEVQAWYSESFGKTISEGTIRTYLGVK